MAKINWQDIGLLAANDVESIQKAIVIPAKEALRQTRFALTGNLTIADNAYAAIITLGQLGSNTSQTLIHNTEYLFQNPLKTTPVGFTPIIAFDSNRVAVPTPQCTLNNSRTDGLTGITARFASPPGVVDLLRSTAQSISSTASTPIQWTSDELSVALTGTTATSGAFSYDYTTTSGSPAVNSKINCSAAGFVLVNASGGFAANSTGLREFWLVKNNATTPRWADTLYQSPPVTTDIRFNLSAVIQVAAGDYLQLYCYQDSGGALNTLAGTVLRFQARYLNAPITYSANVTGILWGG